MMTEISIYHRIIDQGTLSELKGVPDPNFSLPSTINWMRALAFLVDYHKLNFKEATSFYASTTKKVFNIHQENTILEQLLFAAHQVSALAALTSILRKADVARMGIVTWYYGMYAATSAMVTAQDGSFQDDHTGTATVWDRQIASRRLVMHPFDLRVSTLVEKDAKNELSLLRAKGNKFPLIGSSPANADDAYGACVAYLAGSVDWWRSRTEEAIKSSSEFKALKVENFRTKNARELRDKRLATRSVAFLHEAFRYRGKANYRDAVFLGYGKLVEPYLASYINDLSTVLNGFVAATGAFCSKRLGTATWNQFLTDLDANRSFSTSPLDIWT